MSHENVSVPIRLDFPDSGVIKFWLTAVSSDGMKTLESDPSDDVKLTKQDFLDKPTH